MRIAILEDDLTLHALYKMWLETANHQCVAFETAEAFKESVRATPYDLLIVDWMLPDSTGDVIIKWIRESLGWHIPVIFITANDSEQDIVVALRSGADDYIVKPAKCLELLARIEALSRRVTTAQIQTLGVYEINKEIREIRLHGKTIDLTQKEFELANYLFLNHGKLLSRVHLLEKLWGLQAEVDTRTVDTHISRIRRKLELVPENGWKLIPIYGFGYRIEKTVIS